MTIVNENSYIAQVYAILGTPNWYSTTNKPGDLEVVGSKPVRLHTADAEGYLERNKTGTAQNWSVQAAVIY